MDLNIKRKSTKSVSTGSLVTTYPHDLQMYRVPPIENITLQEFETLAVDRLKLLRSLASATTLKGHRIYSDEWLQCILNDLKSEGLKYYMKLCTKSECNLSESDLQARRKDHIGHFILRLAYCRTEELRRWFIAKELELFKLRFYNMKMEAVDTFFKLNNLYYENISSEEKDKIIHFLRESTPHHQVDNMKFYKVKFNEVLDLVKFRKVYLNSGYAFIPHSDFVSVLSAQYRTHLKQSLAIASQHLSEIEQDERIVTLLKGLHLSYTGADYSIAKAVVPIESLDTLAVKSYPLCMRQLHEHLRLAHHLKHGGRLQYGLFLKGIGVTLEDSMRFWREEFTKIMDLDKFEKQYSYNVRYNYGKEGSKKNYSPFSCMKIIQSSVGPGDCHGCPFRHCDGNSLKNRLQGYNLEPQAINNIVDLAKRGHFQIACSKYFNAVHNVELDLGLNHPNEYFEASQKLLRGETKIDFNNGQSNGHNDKYATTELHDNNMEFEEEAE
ncbi:DNA primase large subunit [Eumeta japonica]|uniref:DNA primase large subunit n=1 Tax=Eumeta variegata TaxID=151549 RepID=A0A4C1Y531_EUMVA|nr:DNA primase large subunit [Eumeta japonica]